MLSKVPEGLLAVHNIKDGRIGSWKVSYFCDSSTVVKDILTTPGSDNLVNLHMDHDSVILYICDGDEKWREKYYLRNGWAESDNAERLAGIPW